MVCHALTGNSALDTWWGGLLGPGKAFDTDKYFVVCANVLGSCYGTTGPTSPYPEGDVTSSSSGGGSGSGSGSKRALPYYGLSRFPAITIRDSVRLHRLLVFSPTHAGGRGKYNGLACQWCGTQFHFLNLASAQTNNAASVHNTVGVLLLFQAALCVATMCRLCRHKYPPVPPRGVPKHETSVTVAG